MPWYSGSAPDEHTTPLLRFVPLTEALVDADLDAVMASREYLRRWSESSWPADDFTRSDNEQDLRLHRLEHEAGVAFTYSVLAPQSPRVVGCIYIRPLVDAFRTRGVDVMALGAAGDALTAVTAGAALVRGWIRSDEPVALLPALVAVSVAWLAGDAWSFPEVWWHASSAVADQLAACAAAGLTRAVSIPSTDPTTDPSTDPTARGSTWELRSTAPLGSA